VKSIKQQPRDSQQHYRGLDTLEFLSIDIGAELINFYRWVGRSLRSTSIATAKAVMTAQRLKSEILGGCGSNSP
jgi:hypothetical protein